MKTNTHKPTKKGDSPHVFSNCICPSPYPLAKCNRLSLCISTIVSNSRTTEQILHRDLKTNNIFISGSGPNRILKIGDFGISKFLNTGTKAETVVGTPSYLSPELCEGKPYNDKSDIWAMGCILYEIICLQKMFQGSVRFLVMLGMDYLFYVLEPSCSRYEDYEGRLSSSPGHILGKSQISGSFMCPIGTFLSTKHTRSHGQRLSPVTPP